MPLNQSVMIWEASCSRRAFCSDPESMHLHDDCARTKTVTGHPHQGNRGMSFFAICPFNKRDCKVPKNGMNYNHSMPIVCGLDSSRFSGQWSKHHKACPGATLHITFLAGKEHILSVALNRGIESQVWAGGIAKKDISLFLAFIVSPQKGI
jgi:hypothetical protein